MTVQDWLASAAGKLRTEASEALDKAKASAESFQRDNQYPRPLCKVLVDGRDITGQIEKRLVDLQLTDNRGMEADTLDLLLSDHDGRLAIPPRNASIELWLGWSHTGLVYKGSYTVDETEHSGAPDVLSIRARSADLRASLKVKREQTWAGVTLGGILESIAGRNQLQHSIDAALAMAEIQHMDQANESDANLLTRLAEQFDAVIGVKAGHLLCCQTGEGKSASGLPLPHVTLTRMDGDSHRYLQADRNSYSGVKAYYYQANSGARMEAIAGTGDNLKELRTVYADQASALRAAEAELSRLLRGTATLSYTLAHGRPELMPEQTFSLVGVKSEIDATVWLGSSVTHSFTADSYTTSIELENQLPDIDDISQLADDSAREYTGVIAFYKDKDGKQQKLEKGDMTNPKRLHHLYATKQTAQAAVNREWERMQAG